MTVEARDRAPADWNTAKEGAAIASLRTAFSNLQDALNEAHEAGIDVAFEQRGFWIVGQSRSVPQIHWTAARVLA